MPYPEFQIAENRMQ